MNIGEKANMQHQAKKQMSKMVALGMVAAVAVLGSAVVISLLGILINFCLFMSALFTWDTKEIVRSVIWTFVFYFGGKTVLHFGYKFEAEVKKKYTSEWF